MKSLDCEYMNRKILYKDVMILANVIWIVRTKPDHLTYVVAMPTCAFWFWDLVNYLTKLH